MRLVTLRTLKDGASVFVNSDEYVVLRVLTPRVPNDAWSEIHPKEGCAFLVNQNEIREASLDALVVTKEKP